MALTMREWCSNALYEELIAMPEWIHAAFRGLKEGDVLKPDDVRYRLMQYLRRKTLNKCPPQYRDPDYENDFRMRDTGDIIKSAMKATEYLLDK